LKRLLGFWEIFNWDRRKGGVEEKTSVEKRLFSELTTAKFEHSQVGVKFY